MTPTDPRAPRRVPESRFDPTGIDDGQGGIALAPRRPALRATAWIAIVTVAIAVGALAWRTLERQGVERAYADGVKALANGRTDDARLAFDRVIARRPDWAHAWRQRGYAAATADAAVADFSHAIALDPNDAEAYAARGRAWLRGRNPSRGARDLATALALASSTGVDPATVVAWRADRGAALDESGDPTAAAAEWKAVADARGRGEDHRRVALALASARDWAGARAAQDRAIAAGAEPAWYGERALIAMRLGDDEAAGLDLVRCAQLDATCAAAFGVRAGELARELGRPPPVGAR